MSIENILKEHFSIEGKAVKNFGGYDCENTLIETANGENFVFKKHLEEGVDSALEAENILLEKLNQDIPGIYQSPIQSNRQQYCEKIDGKNHRLVSYIDGDLLTDADYTFDLIESFGGEMAKMHQSLMDIRLDAIEARKRYWDIQYLEITEAYRPYLSKDKNGKLVDYFIQHFNQFVKPQFVHLRKGVIHGDANDMNVLVKDNKIAGIIDFGDCTYAPLIIDIAIALTYVVFEKEDPLAWCTAFLKGYNRQLKLEAKELDLLYNLIAIRCCQSILNAAYSVHENPENKEYIEVSQKNIWDLLENWITINPVQAQHAFYKACGLSIDTYTESSQKLDQERRDNVLSKALSINPIHMVGAAFQYMYAADGKTYLDLRNNIPHVGHCHPKVVKAGQQQMARLNTNTRYYYDALHDYAEHLLSKFPDSLNRVFFVNSGSAATDLALRIATTVTGMNTIMGLEEGYHGNTFKAIEVSHYKYSHSGGKGQQENILKAPMPWNWKHQFGENAGELLSKNGIQIVSENKNRIAGFIAEPIIGCGGQLELPSNYLKPMYEAIRAQGGVCISDEVQTGFARTGKHWWGFEHYDVVPDIVVTGKCIGNGHPMAAVICTEEIAAQFDNGMEFFSSFGGNPVSCEIGNAVLNVIEEEQLKENVVSVSQYFFDQLADLQKQYKCIGSARGQGFFIGIEFIIPDSNYEPNQALCQHVKQYCKDHQILLGSDGPHDNVLKLKPPLCFTTKNTDAVINILEKAIQNF